jgi:transcriptional regulator with XRE-family HTH domain
MVAINFKSIGEKIKDLREKTGFSQAQIAGFLDLDQSHISKIEKGERNISVDLIEKTANLFGCYVGYFTSEDNDYQPIPFALRARDITSDDLKAIADINKIALNLRYMTDVLKLNYK